MTAGEVNSGLIPLVAGSSLFNNIANAVVYPFTLVHAADVNYSAVVNYFTDLGFSPKEQLSVI